MFRNNLKVAWRNLLKNKVSGFVNIAGLAIGMAVAMMIGLWINDELTYNKIHKNYEQLAQLQIHQIYNGKKGTGEAISLPCAPALRNDFGSDFEEIALASWNFEHILVNGENKFLREGMHVEPGYPEMFSLDMLAGSYQEVLQEPNSILLSKSLADALFDKEDPMGKTIRLDSKADMKVTGVFLDLPKNSTLQGADFYVPWAYYLTDQEWVKSAQDQWGNHSFQLFAQINETTDFETVSAKIRDIEKPHYKEGNSELFLFPMSRWHLYSRFEDGVNVGGRIQFVWLFGIIGVFVLLLACINFMNLSTARSEKRAREVGIRKSIGSLRRQLIWQFMSESMLVVFLALAFSISFVQVSLTWFNNLTDKAVSLPWTNPDFWLLTLGFATMTGLLAGSYPAFYLSSFEPLKVLKGTFKAGRWSAVPRQVLVTVQFTVSVVLIIGTIVVFKQIEHAKNRPVGYDREGVVQFIINPELQGKQDLVRNEILNTGAAEEVAYSNSPVTGVWSNQIGFDWEGKDPNTRPLFGIVAVSHEYGKTIDWQVKEGRDFSREFSTDTLAIVLNEAGVALTGIDNVVGMTIRWNDEPYQVVGVVEDMVMESPWRPIKPTVFFINPDWANFFSVRLKEGMPVHDALAKVETVFKKHSPNSPFEYEFTDDEYEEKFRAEERIGKLARVFAFLAIFISCLGLFGLSAFVAEQRNKEIGIRKVLGASVANLWIMQSKNFVGLVILSCLVAAPLAWYFLAGWLSSYEYRIEMGWGVFVTATVLAVMVTLFTVSFQSVKAALANPMHSLRSE